jgi:hypothetical protein
VNGKGLTMRSSLFALAVVLAAAVVLGVAPSALAMTNKVPNGDFETPPAPDPLCGLFHGDSVCDWNPLAPATISWDATNPHAGLHSMQLTGPVVGGGSIEVTTISNICIQIGPGVHSASFWYRTTDTDANQVALGANWYANSTCSVFSTGLPAVNTLSPNTTGAWTQVTGTFTMPAGTGSAFFSVFEGCNSCTGTLTVNVDDIDVEGEVLAVTLESFRAVRSHRGVVLRWRTGTEVDTLGFNVFRQRGGGKRVRVNRRLLPALGAVAGSSYSFVDRRAPRRAARYWLQDVSTHGVRTWHGPVRVPAA